MRQAEKTRAQNTSAGNLTGAGSQHVGWNAVKNPESQSVPQNTSGLRAQSQQVQGSTGMELRLKSARIIEDLYLAVPYLVFPSAYPTSHRSHRQPSTNSQSKNPSAKGACNMRKARTSSVGIA